MRIQYEREKIQDLRTKKGITLTGFSKLSGVSKSYLSFIERGKQNNPSIEVIEKLAYALDVDVHEILGEQHRSKKRVEHLDKEVIDLAIEMSKANIDKEKCRQLIEIVR
jgi:XRE family transcriptional regulator of biofilm formation